MTTVNSKDVEKRAEARRTAVALAREFDWPRGVSQPSLSELKTPQPSPPRPPRSKSELPATDHTFSQIAAEGSLLAPFPGFSNESFSASPFSCPKYDRDWNGRENDRANKKNHLCMRLTRIANGMNDKSTTNKQLIEGALEHDKDLDFLIVEECEGAAIFQRNFELHERRLIPELRAAYIRAMDVLFAAASTALADLRAAYYRVLEARDQFEDDGGGGLDTVNLRHQEFLNQLVLCDRFAIYPIRINGKLYDPQTWYNDVQEVSDAEREISAFDDLDILRNEYAFRKIPVPRRAAFTSNKRSDNFSFDELNDGLYFEWAIITDRLLIALERVRELAGNRPLEITSGYRNPAYNDNVEGGVRNSRHQYGDAADVTPSDLNGDGVVDSRDRDILYQAAIDAGFDPKNIIKKNVTVHMEYD